MDTRLQPDSREEAESVEMVVSDYDHAGAEGVRPGDHPDEPNVDYERAVAQASELVLAHLKACPDDVRLSRARHAEGPTLFGAVLATFPELERMRLTSVMWDHVAGQAIDAFVGDRPDAAGEGEPGADMPD
jgi:hypothetical protein